jgi:heme exporter protein A
VAGHLLPRQAAGVRARLGVVSHTSLLYGDLTAEENLRFFGRMYGISNMAARIDEVLEMVGLETRRRDLVRTFSRGMQQRLAIGRAVLHDPEVMLFDEPHRGSTRILTMLDNVLRSVAAEGAHDRDDSRPGVGTWPTGSTWCSGASSWPPPASTTRAQPAGLHKRS